MALEKWAQKLLWSSAITQGVIYILRPMITYRALELNASAAAIGLIAAAYALLPVFMALTFGRWVGVLGEGKFVIFGTLGLAHEALQRFKIQDIFAHGRTADGL